MGSNYAAIPADSFVELQLQVRKGEFQPESLVSAHGDEDANEECPDADGDDLPLILEDSSRGGSGICGAVFNLATSIIGAGIMALPAAVKVLGILVGTLLIGLMGVISEISVEFLVRFSASRKAYSYGDVVELALGRPVRILSEICIIVNNAGILVVYLIIMGDVLAGSRDHIGVLGQWLGHGLWDRRQLVILVVLLIFLAPLCALQKIDSLSLTSAASVALAVIFVLVSCSVAFVKILEGEIETPRLGPDFGSRSAVLDLLVVIPIMTNAYICHFNVQPIYNELEGRTCEKMNRVGRITTVLCSAVYVLTANSCYLLFGGDTDSDVLTNFDGDLRIPFSTTINYVVRVGYVVHLILVFPLIHFSLRQTVNNLMFGKSGPLSGTRKRSLALTMILLVMTYLGSTVIPNIWAAFKVIGSTTSVSLGFIFPSLVALKLDEQGEPLEPTQKILSWGMIIMAVLVGVLGVVGNFLTL